MTIIQEFLQNVRGDLQRQLDLEGNHATRPGVFQFAKRVLHYRFLPVFLYRISRSTFVAGVFVVPHVCTYLNIVLFGIEISPRCKIGPRLFLPHTSGTVIGAYEIGGDATIFQGVTLGATCMDMKFEPGMRPHIGNNVVLGAGSKVIGGVTLGDCVTVGANAVVLSCVESNSTVVGIPAKKLHREG